MSTTVFFVRHGQTKSNITGYFMGRSNEDISDLGYAQVRSLSSRLASLPVASMYTSPLPRTINTARILAEPHKLELKVLDDLIEIGLGDWQGLHRDEISQTWPEIWRQSRIDPSDVTFPNGESFQQVTERAVRAFNRIVADNTNRHALAVTHDAVIRVLAAHVLGTSNSIYRHMEINNASLSIIRVEDDRVRLVTLNDTAHLDRAT
ncbi:MAG: histidine phosphatase family protein [Dehalococcoidales bacterium]|nr:histidine phosphatase family protein [Dehalococcoidales bacterium]